MKRAKKKPCPCVALEMDENACDGCDMFESENKLKECLVRFLKECKKAYGLDKLKRCLIKILDALTEKKEAKQ